MLKIDQLNVYKKQNLCVRDVSFSVKKGEVFSILGINGAGKSSLALALAGHLSYTAAIALFNEDDISKNNSQQLVQKGIAFIPEQKFFFNGMTVEEHLGLAMLALTLLPHKSFLTKRLEEVYHLFPRLFERKKQIATTLSGGEQQMLLIASSLMIEPKLFILDEPSQGLSLKMVDHIFDILTMLSNQGMGVILIEQNIYQALDISHNACVLENGKMTLSGPAVDVKNHPDLNNICLGLS
jgi:branched-chain amino acid transport system ATP-binding protein